MTKTVRSVAGAASMILEDNVVYLTPPVPTNVRDARYAFKAMFTDEAPLMAMLRATEAVMKDNHAQATFWVDVYFALQQPSQDD